MSYFFFLYQLPSLSFSTVSDSISSNIDEVLSINPSTNVFVFGEDFNIHHKDWLTYSGGTDQSWKIYYNFSMTFLLGTDSHSPALLDLFFLMLVFVLQNVPFHHITDEYSQAEWDSLHDHLGNVKLIFCFA